MIRNSGARYVEVVDRTKSQPLISKSPITDSHETRIAALEADIEELRQALSRILPTIEELETWIGD